MRWSLERCFVEPCKVQLEDEVITIRFFSGTRRVSEASATLHPMMFVYLFLHVWIFCRSSPYEVQRARIPPPHVKPRVATRERSDTAQAVLAPLPGAKLFAHFAHWASNLLHDCFLRRRCQAISASRAVRANLQQRPPMHLNACFT